MARIDSLQRIDTAPVEYMSKLKRNIPGDRQEVGNFENQPSKNHGTNEYSDFSPEMKRWLSDLVDNLNAAFQTLEDAINAIP